MPPIVNKCFEEKAIAYKRPLLKRRLLPVSISEMRADSSAFQGLRAVPVTAFSLPLAIKNGEKILIDFGDHGVGHLHFRLENIPGQRIIDSPIKLRFSFGEFPLEIAASPEDYHGSLGNGWLQHEEKSVVFAPYSGILERRYAFRYLLIERKDTSVAPVVFTELYAECTSAADPDSVQYPDISDPVLETIYRLSLKTLRECEQDVFEDGPKRDRRLWIGDLRLQALTDYVTFKNIDLIKRCIYLFAAYRTDEGKVAPCIFPDSPPFIDGWTFPDYSLFFISCLHDYLENTGDLEVTEELFPTALEQAKLAAAQFDCNKNLINADPFIDWCPDLDKSVALLGVYLYTLEQLKTLSIRLGKPIVWIEKEMIKARAALLTHYSPEKGVFITPSGQISWHSQVWAVLSGTLSGEESIRLLDNTELLSPETVMHTPYMIHYYLEALDKCGLHDKMTDVLKQYWGAIAACGFDCCPEVFNPQNPFESPYSAPEINSACHAWSCTPAYWISKLSSAARNPQD